MNEKKIIIAVAVFVVLMLVGAVVLLGKSSTKATLQKTAGAKIETPETSFDFGDIDYSGGNAEHKYAVKNIGDKQLKLANLVTSCMCTKVYFKSATEESPKFGMPGHSNSSDWTGSLDPGKEAQIIAIFDPTAHGPSGVGPVSRFVSFGTNDPDHPYIELSFTGVVVKR